MHRGFCRIYATYCQHRHIIGVSLSEPHSSDVNGVVSCNCAFDKCPQGIMSMHRPYNLMNWCEVIMFCTTLIQQLKTIDQAERTQESECGSRARAKETPEQRAQRLARWRKNTEQKLEPKKHPSRGNRSWQNDSKEQYRECRARATAQAFLQL